MLKVRFVIIAGLILIAVSGVFAQQAVITELSGMVEVKRAGSAVWENAVRGQTLTMDSMISTGFKSTALFKAGSLVITVRPLTRLTLTEIAAAAGTETVNVNLQAGRVKVEVDPPQGTRANVTVRGPMATASVRGTVFEVDTFSLWVSEGTVEYAGRAGAPVLIDAGGVSFVNESTGRAALPEGALKTSFRPEMPVGFDVFYSFEGAGSGNAFEVVTVIDYQ